MESTVGKHDGPHNQPNRILLSFALVLCSGLVATNALGQSYLTGTGSPSFSAPEPVELGFVDASNGNLHLSIPLGSYPQRGSSQAEQITLEYDSSMWTPVVDGSIALWEPNNSLGSDGLNGWYFSFDAGDQTNNLAQTNSQGCTTDEYWRDKNGTTHAFHLNTAAGNQSCPATADAFAADSSGYHMYWPTGGNLQVYAPDGTLVYSQQLRDPNGHLVMSKDSNGNYLSADSIDPYIVYDTLGRQIAAESGYGSGSHSVTMMTSQGTSSYSINASTINVSTNFQQTQVQETGTQIVVIQSVTLPDAAQSTYQFTYDCDESGGNPACGSPAGQSAYYGELIGIKLPTGGTVSYSYLNFQDAYGNKGQWVSTHSAANGIWSYTPAVLSTCGPTQVNCKQQTTVNAPNGITVYTFQLNNGAWPTNVAHEDLSSNVLSTVSNTFDFSQSCVLLNCHGASYVRLLTQQTTIPTVGGNLVKQTSYTYDSPQKGNQTKIQEWRYIPAGGSFPSLADRTTYVSYLSTGTNNINRPLSVTACSNSGTDSACSGGGSRVTQTLYTYDSYGSGGLKSISGVAQHDDANFGTSYATRGNATSIAHWVSGSTYLTSSYTYDTTGQVLTATDPAGNQTQYSYADNFFTDPGNGTAPTSYSPASPTNAYLTSVTDPIGTQTSGYYFGSGKLASSTDYNAQSTYYHYQDGLDRTTEESDPIGWTLANYSSAVQSDMYSAVADTAPSVNCASCQHTQTVLDSWGRTSSTILVNNPIGAVEVDSTYDQAGRLATQSHPYSGSGDPNYVFETFGYDALNRPLSTTHPDGELQQAAYGATTTPLGGISSQQGSASTYGYGYPQISEDEAGHQHQQWMDGFGRVVEVDEPSTSSAAFASIVVSVADYSGDWDPENPCEPHYSCPQYLPNSGIVYLTVGTYTATAPYGPDGNIYPGYETASQVASALGEYLNGDPNAPVTASVSGSSITLTAKGPGSPGDLSFSSSETYNSSTGFTAAAFDISPASGSLSGGSGGITSSPYYTNYIYDAADHLTQVVQGAQTRTFAYDGIGRKVSETTPEGGTVTYAYTTSGGSLCSGDASNVCQRTDARGVVTAYTYDHGNRLTGVAYTILGGKNIAAMPNVCTTTPNGTPANVCEYYDQGGAAAYAVGRLTEMVDPTGSESYAHDSAGRITQLFKVTNGKTYTTGYKYDAGGDVTQITYPSGRVVYQAYNAIGQLCQVSASSSGCNGTGYYAGGFSYGSPGTLTGFTYGNGVSAAFGYSAPRTQLSSLKYTFGTQTYLNLGYWYQTDSSNCPTGAAQNNGSIQCITDAVNSGRSVNYSFDAIGRMTTAKTNGSSGYPQWGLSESYDRYGNRLSQSVTAGSGPSSSLSFTSKNQPTGYTFDASGNMTVEPLSPPNNMTYDGENRMTAFSGNGGSATYTYDGNGLRVVKGVSGGTTTVTVFAGSSVIAEYDNGAAPTAPSREYIYNPAGGETTGLLAMISGGATTYYHQDHLLARLTTEANGNILTQEGSFPFGEQWYETGPTNSWFFTSYDRDSESGLDYALARYYNSRTGTFCSADPLAGDPSDPQSWNRYPYGRNDPIDITDPSGKSWWSSLLIDAGIGVAMYFLGPEIAAWLGPGETAGGGAAAAQAHIAADVASGAAIPSSTSGLFYRGAASAIGAGVDGAAGAGGGAAWGLGGAAAAQAAQSTDQPKPKRRRQPAGVASHTNCPPGTTADTSGDPDYTGGASEYGVNENGSLTRFAGRRTASGKIFNPWGFTAATRAGANGQFAVFPKFSYVNVVSAANPAKNVVVQITDTGALGTDDLLDLSAGAMKQLTGKAFNRVPVNIYPCHPGGK